MVGNFPLTKLVVQKTAKRAFVGNKKGHIFIYDISPVNTFSRRNVVNVLISVHRICCIVSVMERRERSEQCHITHVWTTSSRPTSSPVWSQCTTSENPGEKNSRRTSPIIPLQRDQEKSCGWWDDLSLPLVVVTEVLPFGTRKGESPYVSFFLG